MEWNSSTRDTTKFLRIKERAKAVRCLYAAAGVTLPLTCGLSRFIQKSIQLVENAESGTPEPVPFADIVRAMHMLRVAEAILSLDRHPQGAHYLSLLTQGDVDFFQREPSTDKDIIWELELCSALRALGGACELQDPPDIVVKLDAGRLGIACKKIYSEDNLPKVLSKAASQVQPFDAGLAAINIDNATPQHTVLNVGTKSEVDRFLHRTIDEFLANNERHSRRTVSCAALARLADMRSTPTRLEFQALLLAFWRPTKPRLFQRLLDFLHILEN